MSSTNIILDDGNDSLLIEAYNKVSHKFDIKCLLDDGEDELLIESYERWNVSKQSPIPPNMIEHVQFSVLEIQRKKLIAKVKSRDSKGGHYFHRLLNDLFCSVNHWPSYMIGILFSSTFSYIERLHWPLFTTAMDSEMKEQQS